eukprot:gb/GECG01004036.1/.p1 GENE.gb/GECG01004036.1/~~gb/GECG01004036.1/.p1  ORF type:complete len:109 (+),score=5.81 gb/GECG01004036.1/:1-327(+)
MIDSYHAITWLWRSKVKFVEGPRDGASSNVSSVHFERLRFRGEFLLRELLALFSSLSESSSDGSESSHANSRGLTGEIRTVVPLEFKTLRQYWTFNRTGTHISSVKPI